MLNPSLKDIWGMIQYENAISPVQEIPCEYKTISQPSYLHKVVLMFTRVCPYLFICLV